MKITGKKTKLHKKEEKKKKSVLCSIQKAQVKKERKLGKLKGHIEESK
jgi:hypothetical protein